LKQVNLPRVLLGTRARTRTSRTWLGKLRQCQSRHGQRLGHAPIAPILCPTRSTLYTYIYKCVLAG